jgi:hypothetical protein
MTTPHCPEHGRLVLDLALGALDDEQAAAAEDARSSCPACSNWWRAELEGEAAQRVDSAVAEVLGRLVLPARRRHHRWMALAAVAVMTFGVGALWLVREPAQDPSLSAGSAPTEAVAVIRSFDFEEETPVVRIDPPVVPVEETRTQALATATTEPAIAAEIVIADSAATPGSTTRDGDSIFAGGFENGDLSGWVPST